MKNFNKTICVVNRCAQSLFIALAFTFLFNQASFCQIITVETKNNLDKTLASLVSFETLSNQKEVSRAALHWVKEQLIALPLVFREYESNGYPSLVITTLKTKIPKLWLIAHIDVVAASPSMFHLQSHEDKIIGRGVLDMKAAISSYITLLKEIGPSLGNYNLGVMLTADEELGGMNGVRYLLEEQNFRGKLGFLPDGGFDWHIEENAKGALWIKIVTKGVTSHGSRPWLGVNAINNLNKILDSLTTYFDQIKLNAPQKNYYTTMNIGMVHGGQSANQVPDHAEAIIDIRYTPSFDINAFKKSLDNLVQSIRGTSYEILVMGKPNHVDLTQPEVKKFKELAKKLYGINIGTTQAHGTTDARFFSDKDIPVLIISPTGGEIHSEHEWLSQKNYYAFYHVLKEWVREIGKR